jgi:hypothetical protein
MGSAAIRSAWMTATHSSLDPGAIFLRPAAASAADFGSFQQRKFYRSIKKSTP